LRLKSSDDRISPSQLQLDRRSGKCRSTDPERHNPVEGNTAERGSAMLRTIACWIRDRSRRYPTLVCVALMMVAPVAVHADAATLHFDIKAQPLSEALMAFGAQTGTIVMASSEITTGKISKPVTGQLTCQDALTRMLQGTGLKFETNADGTFLIVRAPAAGR
jgi:hypothetical protein